MVEASYALDAQLHQSGHARALFQRSVWLCGLCSDSFKQAWYVSQYIFILRAQHMEKDHVASANSYLHTSTPMCVRACCALKRKPPTPLWPELSGPRPAKTNHATWRFRKLVASSSTLESFTVKAGKTLENTVPTHHA
eukprot:934628-Amphidinium_carterae.1